MVVSKEVDRIYRRQTSLQLPQNADEANPFRLQEAPYRRTTYDFSKVVKQPTDLSMSTFTQYPEVNPFRSSSPLKRPLPPAEAHLHQNAQHIRKRRKLMPLYFRSQGLRAVEVMFPSDEEKPTLENIFVDNISNISHPTGERLYVQKLMRKFLLNPDRVEFTHNDKSRTVWKLHSENLVNKHEQHMALVFDVESQDECKVFKAPVDVLGIPQKPSRRPRKDKNGVIRFHYDEPENPFDAGGDWGYLSKWNHMEDDKLLPLFNESDSEDGGYDHATLREMEIEERQRNGKLEPVAKPLSIDAVREVIANALRKFEEIWAEKELPKWEARGYRLYMKQHRQKSKKRTVSKHRKELERLETRIQRFRKGYEEVDWRSINELKKICVNMRETVHRIQELQWQIGLLSGVPPERPIKADGNAEAVDDSVDEMMDIIDSGGEEADNEDLDNEDVEEFDEDDDLEGFVIPDDEIEFVLPDDVGGFGDQDDLDDSDNDKDIDVELSTPKRSGNRGKRVVLSESDGDDEPDEAGDSGDMMIEDTEGMQESAEDKDPVELTTEENENVPSPSRDAETRAAKPRPSLSSGQQAAETLPTPPHETDEDPPPTQIKQEPSAPPITDDVPNLSDYDSDIFMSFGDKEVSKFCQCTEKSPAVAKSYLLKADGDTSRAITFFYEDVDNGHFQEPLDSERPMSKKLAGKQPAVTLSPLQTRGQRKDKVVKKRRNTESISLDTDDDNEAKEEAKGSSVSDNMSSLFDITIPPDGDLFLAIKNLVSSLTMRDLHDTVIEVATMVQAGNVQLKGSFIAGETPQNCDAYLQIYSLYVRDNFVNPSLNASPRKMDGIRDSQLFEKFYKRLVSYLNIEPAPVPVEGKGKNKFEPPSSPSSQLENTPSKSLPGGKKPKKEKKKAKQSRITIVKPLKKSAEQIAQEASLRRLADREREQKKKGDVVTVAPDGSVLVNPFHKKTEDSVWLHPEIAAALKPHQVDGLQFMWRQVLFALKP
jgi:hypothetical protein